MIHNVFFDGGTALHMICVFDQTRNKSFVEKIERTMTNNELEYTALLKAVRYATVYYGCPRNTVFCGDSELIIKQMKGEYGIKKPHLRMIYDKIKEEFLSTSTPMIGSNFRWVPRKGNFAGILLEHMLEGGKNVRRNN